MKYIVLVLLFCVSLPKAKANGDPKEWTWELFKEKFNKSYESPEEERRKQIFQENLERIVQNNAKFNTGESKFKLGVNAFADMTKEEFQNTHVMTMFTGEENSSCRSTSQWTLVLFSSMLLYYASL